MNSPWLNPGRWILCGLLLVSLYFGVLALDQARQKVGYDHAQTEYTAQAEKADEKREAVAAPLAVKQEAAQVKIRTVTKTLIEKVPVYVQADACPLPGGFRLLHDAAAANVEVPDATGLVDAAPVPAADAASTIVSNYGIARSNAARLVGLQEWVKAQGELK